MKKIVLTIAIVLGITLASFAQKGGGLFQRGAVSDEVYYGGGYNRNGQGSLLLPTEHGYDGDTDAPLGGGVLLLIGFGAAYAMKKRKEK